MSTKIPQKLMDLYHAAHTARDNAYCPYSNYKVGAAIRVSDGTLFSGCNVENSSYGATCCAERVAIQSAVSQRGKVTLIEVMVVTDSMPPAPPCGICRQVIAEFGKDAEIHTANLKGEFKSYRLKELLPEAFSSSYLPP